LQYAANGRSAAFAKELAGLQNADHGFLALLGYDNNLDPTFLNIEDRICHVALGKDDLILAKFKDGLPLANLGEKLLGIEYCLNGIVCHVRFRPRAGTLLYHLGRRRPKQKRHTIKASHQDERGFRSAEAALNGAWSW
jgi:hypothetical protein